MVLKANILKSATVSYALIAVHRKKENLPWSKQIFLGYCVFDPKKAKMWDLRFHCKIPIIL